MCPQTLKFNQKQFTIWGFSKNGGCMDMATDRNIPGWHQKQELIAFYCHAVINKRILLVK